MKKRSYWVLFAVMVLVGAFLLVFLGSQNQLPVVPDVSAQQMGNYGSTIPYNLSTPGYTFPGDIIFAGAMSPGDIIFNAKSSSTGNRSGSSSLTTLMTCYGCGQTISTCMWNCGPTFSNCPSPGRVGSGSSVDVYTGIMSQLPQYAGVQWTGTNLIGTTFQWGQQAWSGGIFSQQNIGGRNFYQGGYPIHQAQMYSSRLICPETEPKYVYGIGNTSWNSCGTWIAHSTFPIGDGMPYYTGTSATPHF